MRNIKDDLGEWNGFVQRRTLSTIFNSYTVNFIHRYLYSLDYFRYEYTVEEIADEDSRLI